MYKRQVFILSAMDEPEDVLALLPILKELRPCRANIPSLPMLTAIPETAMEVRQAAMAECENVLLTECVGRIAAAPAGLYPPGVPLVCPGERVTQETADRLINVKNQERFGVEGDTLLCVKL